MRIAFIGLGEAATAIISGWDIMQTNSITAFDIKSDNSDTVDEIIELEIVDFIYSFPR